MKGCIYEFIVEDASLGKCGTDIFPQPQQNYN